MADITKEQVLKALEKVNDPELRLNIVDLGLIYDVEVSEDNLVLVDMSLTTQACPAGPIIQAQVEQVLKNLPGVRDAAVQLIFEPPWTPDRMSARLKKARAMGLL